MHMNPFSNSVFRDFTTADKTEACRAAENTSEQNRQLSDTNQWVCDNPKMPVMPKKSSLSGKTELCLRDSVT